MHLAPSRSRFHRPHLHAISTSSPSQNRNFFFPSFSADSVVCHCTLVVWCLVYENCFLMLWFLSSWTDLPLDHLSVFLCFILFLAFGFSGVNLKSQLGWWIRDKMESRSPLLFSYCSNDNSQKMDWLCLCFFFLQCWTMVMYWLGVAAFLFSWYHRDMGVWENSCVGCISFKS